MLELLFSPLMKQSKGTDTVMGSQNWWVSSKQTMDFAKLLASKTNM